MDLGALRRARNPSVWADGAFRSRFAVLVALAGPAHEIAVFLCVLHNGALTTLIAGGFKSTALSGYHALVASAISGESPQDAWDALGIAITAAASLVYTVEWFKANRRKKVKDSAGVPNLHPDFCPRRSDLPAWRRRPRKGAKPPAAAPAVDSLMRRPAARFGPHSAHHHSSENLLNDHIFGAPATQTPLRPPAASPPPGHRRL